VDTATIITPGTKSKQATLIFITGHSPWEQASTRLPVLADRPVPYFDSHHHEAAATATTMAAKSSNAGMHPLTNSRVAGSVILNIMTVLRPD
jgi:hypothetical protein